MQMFSKVFQARFLFASFLAVLLVVMVGCGKHAVVPPGKEGVNEKTAGYRTVGGGIETTPYLAGKRHKIGGSTSKSRMMLMPIVPFTIKKELKVRMINWSNLDMEFDVTLTGTLVPGKTPQILKDIGENWKKTNLEQPLVTVSQDVLTKQTRESLRDREAICSAIKNALEGRLKQRGKTAAECIRIVDITLNNMDYPQKILADKAKAAKAEYLKQVVTIENQIKEYEGLEEEIRAETTNLGYSIEAGAISTDFLAWQNFEVMKQMLLSDNKITLVVQLDKNGVPTYLRLK